jgi:hypothetical protein
MGLLSFRIGLLLMESRSRLDTMYMGLVAQCLLAEGTVMIMQISYIFY